MVQQLTNTIHVSFLRQGVQIKRTEIAFFAKRICMGTKKKKKLVIFFLFTSPQTTQRS